MDGSDLDRDAITSEVTRVRDSGGGSLHRVGSLPVVVMNGTYEEMGRQYGDLMKDELHATRDRWKQIFVDSGALSFESILEAIGRPFYTSVASK